VTLKVRPDRTLIRPLSRSQRFLLVDITAPPSDRRTERSPVNLAFVLDRSGSMDGQKIQLARRAVEEGIRRLDARDRFTIVSYDDQIDTVVESTPASAEAKHNALARLAAIDARGSTNLAEGWLRGCEQVARHSRSTQIDRCLLLTDGLANVGITDRAELERHASEIAERGVTTSTFGVGVDFDEQLLEGLATNGRGNFRYIEGAVQIPDFITSEVGETLDVVARGVTLEVETEPGVLVDTLGTFKAYTVGARTVVELGDLVSEQRVDLVLRLSFPYGEIGRSTGVRLTVRDRDGVLDRVAGVADVAWQYADNAANDAQPRDRDVDLAVATRFAAKARLEAVALNKGGQFGPASDRLAAVGRRIRRYAGSDVRLRALADELEQQTVAYSAPVAPMVLKQTHFASVNARMSRDPMGGAWRRS
jgi:Ca-activated chloride channel family protein